MSIGSYTLDEITEGRLAQATLRELAAEMERTDREIAGEERAAKEKRQAKLAERLVAPAESTAKNTERRLVRSKMTVAQKSEYVRQHGQEGYLALSWSG
jgi:hypothetical protein